MKTRNLLLFASMIAAIGIESCSTFEIDSPDEPSLICGFSDPIVHLSWLSEKYQAVKDIPYSGIILYRYNGKEVIEIQSPLMSSHNLSQYYCDGTRLQFDTPETYENDYRDFRTKSVKVKVLYGIDLWKL